jgi:hypothetical protein
MLAAREVPFRGIVGCRSHAVNSILHGGVCQYQQALRPVSTLSTVSVMTTKSRRTLFSLIRSRDEVLL